MGELEQIDHSAASTLLPMVITQKNCQGGSSSCDCRI